MTKSNSIDIEWNLSCPQAEALKKLGESIDNKFNVGLFRIRGRVEDNYFKIWTKTPGMRGSSIAVGKGQIIEKSKNTSQLFASLSISWPYYYFQFPKRLMIFIVILAAISWCFSLTGAIFPQYEILSKIFFPIGVMAIFTILFSFIKYLGESERNDLRKFLENSFANQRQ